MSNVLHNYLETAFQELPQRPLHVGYSGGADSTALLHLLHGIASVREAGLRAIHVHHGLSAEADRWAEHCRRFCDSLGVPLTVLRAQVDRGSGGLEAAARKARHAAFGSVVGADEILATAHHRDDQTETFLLRALRASGPDALGAMRPLRRFGRCWLWRPLLGIPRSALLDYAARTGLAWIEDPSNDDTDLDRNFLRHRVLPLLRERWPQADAAFALSAALCAEAGNLLDNEDAAALAQARSADPHALRVDALASLPAARRARALRRWIAELGLPPLPAQGVARIGQDLMAAAADGNAAFAWSGAVVRRWRGILHADRQYPALPGDWETVWDGSSPLPLPGGGELALEGATAFDRALRAHARRGGERIVLPGRGHSHALKHALQALAVPPWERIRLPLLSEGETVHAAGDLLYSAEFDAWLRGRGARLVWTP